MRICPEPARRAARLLAFAACFGSVAFADGAGAESTGAPFLTEGIENLSDIQWGQTFKVLVPGQALVRTLTPIEQQAHRVELELIERFAEKHYLAPVFVPVDRRTDLIPALLSGTGHVIAANLRVTTKRKARIAFTEPIYTLREQLVVRLGDEIRSAADLRRREIAVRERSSFWNVIQEVRKSEPEIGVRLLPERVGEEEILRGVVEGRYDMAAVDVTALHQSPEDWQVLKVVPGLFEDQAIAWGTHPDAAALLEALNHFLRKEQLSRRPQSIYKDDFPGIKQRKVLRVLTRNNATTYFIWRGKLMGFEYDLLKKFVDEHGIQLEMIVPPSRDQLIPMLLWGGGDVIAASLTISDERRSHGLEFTLPYNVVSEVLVARKDDPIAHVSQLEGRTLWVRRSSSYWTTLDRLRVKGDVRFILKAAREELETEEIIDRVAKGEYDLTVSDSHILDVALTWRDDVRAVFELKNDVKHGWAVRKDDANLLMALNEFIEKEYKQLFYNVVYEKYFRNPRRIKSLVKYRADGSQGAALSPYDDIVRRYAEEYGFDWPLIVAVMFRESRFDKNAESWAGAQGVMQILPVSAKRFGVEDPSDPEKGILAGIRMLAWIYSRFEQELPVKERTWFTLAAYNAGLGHLFDARALAREEGLDPNRWFENVEKAMLLLSRSKYYRKATHGYVRGIEPVTYVRDIRKLYNAYRQLLTTN